MFTDVIIINIYYLKLSPNPGDKLHKMVSDYGLQLLFIANGKYSHY